LSAVLGRTRHARVSFPDCSPFSADTFWSSGAFLCLSGQRDNSYRFSIPTCLLSFPRYTTFEMASKYGPEVTKWDIFHYVYAMLHHPQYREHYTENLKRDLPHIPLLHRKEAFLACVAIGRQLTDLHLHYEEAKEYPLKWIENKDVPFSWRVERMKLTPDKSAIIVNESLTLSGIPQDCFQYRLGNRSGS
jgi:predicted helicase